MSDVGPHAGAGKMSLQDWSGKEVEGNKPKELEGKEIQIHVDDQLMFDLEDNIIK